MKITVEKSMWRAFPVSIRGASPERKMMKTKIEVKPEMIELNAYVFAFDAATGRDTATLDEVEKWWGSLAASNATRLIELRAILSV